MSTPSIVPMPILESERATKPPVSVFPIDAISALVHDLKSPLAALTMNLEYAISELPPGEACDEAREVLLDCRFAGARLTAMIANALDVARSESGKLAVRAEHVGVGALLRTALQIASNDPGAHGVLLRFEGYEGDFELDPALLGRVLACLLDSALTGVRAGSTLTLVAELGDRRLELRLPILGVTFSPEDRARAFRKHSLLSARGFDRGRSLYFARLAVEAHAGTIEIAEGANGRPFFRIALPVKR